MISGNMVGMYSTIGKTLVLTDDSGNEVIGVIVDQEVIFTAGDNDVRQGKIYASDEGVSTGTKEIPAYHISEGERVITNGSKFIIPTPNYDYTKMQAIICSFDTSLDESVSAEKVVINDNVYNVQSITSLSVVQKDKDNSWIDLGFTNTSGAVCVLRYFTYKEIY